MPRKQKNKRKLANGVKLGSGFVLADFVRARPTAKPREIVEAAAALGHNITGIQVAKARYTIGHKLEGDRPNVERVPNDAAPQGRPVFPMTAFVRTQPLSVPNEDVVVAAKKAGIKVTLRQVQQIRYRMKRLGVVPAATATKRGGLPKSQNGHADSTAEAQLRRSVTILGLDKVVALVEEFSGVRLQIL